MGWQGLANGELLEKAKEQFDVFITGDRNLTFQQSAARFDIAIVVLHAPSIQLKDTEVLMPDVLEVMKRITPGQVANVFRRP